MWKKLRKSHAAFLTLSCLYSSFSHALIILNANDVERNGNAVKSSYGRLFHYVPREMGMGFVADLYQIERGHSLSILSTKSQYEGLNNVGGRGEFILEGELNARHFADRSFLALGVHNGYRITANNKGLSFLSVKRTIATSETPI